MKNIISMLTLLFVIATGYSQDLLEVEIDSLHCQDSKCFFINFSSLGIYTCDFYEAEQTEDIYNYVLDCGIDRIADSNLKKSNILDLKRIKEIDEFKNWISDLSFAGNYVHRGDTIWRHYSSIDKNYGIVNIKKLDKNTNSLKAIDPKIFQIIPIKINGTYFIGGLKEIEDESIDYFIIPTRNNLGLMVDYKGFLQPNNKPETIETSVYKRIFSSYKIRSKNDKVILTNSTSSSSLIKKEFENLVVQYPYIVAYSDGRYHVYDEKLKNITPKNLRVAYSNNGRVQMIVGDKIQWFDNQYNLSDSVPNIIRHACYSGEPCYEKRIIKIGESFSEEVIDCNLIGYDDEKRRDTFRIDLKRKISDIKYVNNYIVKKDNLYCEYSFFCHEPDLYYFKTRDGTEGVFRHINEKSEKINSVRINKTLSYRQKKDSLQKIERQTVTSYRDVILFEGKFEDFILESYHQPILFRENGLFGVYPLMKEGKFKSISKFSGYLAEVVFIDGRKGWIDVYGNEFKVERK